MSNKMSLREISSSHVKAFEQICFIRILKKVSQQGRKIYVHGNSNRLLEDLIPNTTMILLRISSVAFISTSEYLCVESEWCLTKLVL